MATLPRRNTVKKKSDRDIRIPRWYMISLSAAAVAAVTNNHVSEKIQVRLPGGILDINYSKGKTVVMSGPTEINFNGEYKIN